MGKDLPLNKIVYLCAFKFLKCHPDFLINQVPEKYHFPKMAATREKYEHTDLQKVSK